MNIYGERVIYPSKQEYGPFSRPTINFLGVNGKSFDEKSVSKKLKCLLDFDYKISKKDMKLAKKNLKEILSYIPNETKDFIKNGGKINLAPFKIHETNAYTDIYENNQLSITYNIKKLIDMSKKAKIAKAATFAHEKVHADDIRLKTGSLEEKAAGSLQEEVDADMAKFNALKKLWKEGKIDYQDLFDNNGIINSIKDLINIDEKNKTFNFSTKGEENYYIKKFQECQQALDRNYQNYKNIYDLDNDGKLDLESLGHKYKGPEILKSIIKK